VLIGQLILGTPVSGQGTGGGARTTVVATAPGGITPGVFNALAGTAAPGTKLGVGGPGRTGGGVTVGGSTTLGGTSDATTGATTTLGGTIVVTAIFGQHTAKGPTTASMPILQYDPVGHGGAPIAHKTDPAIFVNGVSPPQTA